LPDAAAWTAELQACRLCEWRCGVDRLAGETGVCGIGLPQVASRTLHPAPPGSYTIFMAGCNFRCLYCQNWEIAHYPFTGAAIDGLVDPGELAAEGVRALRSIEARLVRADRLFFSGGCSTCSLPYVEEVVRLARELQPGTLVNFDTNGFATKASMQRIIDLADSVTFDIRAVDDRLHRALTGAPCAPVLGNAALMAEHPDKLWEFRILLVPGMNEEEVEPICRFIADLSPDLPLCFLAFRPNFVLDRHGGAPLALMERAVETARDCGLTNADWAGRPGIHALPGAIAGSHGRVLAEAYATEAGCRTIPRSCGDCPQMATCALKRHQPSRRT
jgi:pyruvate formate lyase activating enzyme